MLTNRPPIIVILGHVDHGKTTLLDYLRQSNIASREAGGITQAIRSFQLTTGDQGLMTFIDTPGHAAFSAMRQRGSHLADLAILVIAADDGVMPQTRESLEFIRSSGIPFIVAISKIDMPSADPDRIKTQLTESEVVVEELGGDVPVVSISAKTGQGLDNLLEIIGLITQLNPPQSDPEAKLEAVVLESHLDSQKGPLAVVVIKNGTLTLGRTLYQEQSIGKVKALVDPEGRSINSALPSQPVEILGLAVVPEIGSVISDTIMDVSPVAKTPDHETEKSGEGGINIVLRTDVAGSLEAILGCLPPEVNVISSGTGNINENDILQARPASAQVIGFNVKPSVSISKLAQTEKVSLATFRIIYELLDYLSSQLHPVSSEKIVGRAKVLADFKIESDRIAGCRCTEGLIDKAGKIKVMRGDVLVGEARIKSLRQGKNLLDKAKSSAEFGAVFSPYIDFKIGDDIIATTG